METTSLFTVFLEFIVFFLLVLSVLGIIIPIFGILLFKWWDFIDSKFK